MTERIQKLAYQLADNDNFKQSPEFYWHRAKSLIYK